MAATAKVSITSFGEGRMHVPLAGHASVADLLRTAGIKTEGRRIAVNGHAADVQTGVLEGDEVTLVPRVEGG